MGLFPKKAYVGLDLGHHALKAVQLDPFAGGWRVARYGVYPTPPGCVKDGVVTEAAPLAAAIKQLIKDSHITATSAFIAVSGNSVVVRPVRIPKMAESTLRKSIKFEASRYVPNSPEDSYIEFEILGDSDEGQMDVLMVAAPKDIVDTRIQACVAAGLEVEAVDIEAFAMYRALVETDQVHDWGAETVALVDIGATSTAMSIVRSGSFAMTRVMPTGGQAFTDVLKNYFKLSEEDAESGKTQLDVRGLLDDETPKENPPLRVIQPQLDDLVREIRRSLNYFQSQQSPGGEPSTVKRVLITGNGARMVGLADYVGQKLNMPAQRLGVFDNPRFTNAPPDEDAGEGLAIATGLAMRAFAKVA